MTTTTTTLSNGHTVTRENRADGTRAVTTRDYRGRVVRFEDSSGHWYTNEYDEQGRLVRSEGSLMQIETSN